MPNQKAIASLLQEAPTLLAAGQGNILEDRIKCLPGDMVETNPWLLYYLGVCRMGQNLPEARKHFERAFEKFTSGKEIPGTVLSWSGIVDTIAYEWSDLRPIDKWVKWYDENLRDSIPAPFPDPKIEAGLVSAMVNAITFRLSSHPDCDMWLKRAYAVLENESGDVNQRIMLGTNMVLLHTLGREAYRTVPLMVYLKKLSLLPGTSVLSKLMCLIAEAQFDWAIIADGDKCVNLINEGLKLADSSGIHFLDHVLVSRGCTVP